MSSVDAVHAALIANQPVFESTGRSFSVHCPTSGEKIGEVADCGAVEAQAAVDAACAAFAGWRDLTVAQRADVLLRWHALLLTHEDELAELISMEQGKVLSESRSEVRYGASYVRWFAEEARRSYGVVIPEPVAGRRLMAVQEPVGVVAIITPWNFPLAMLTRKISPALAAGCTVVARPAEDTPLVALALAKLAVEAGIPPGVLSIVPSSRARVQELSDVWMRNSAVRKISFTGSTAVGKTIAARATETLKKVSLELGGNAPFLVFDDADLISAVRGAVLAKFRNNGQTCISPNRFLVQDGIYDEFVNLLGKSVSTLRVGDPKEPETQVGPLINEAALRKVERHVQDALDRGAKLVTGGRRSRQSGFFFEPTVIADATPDMLLAREETFGPVAALFRFNDEREALAVANSTPFGLAAYVYTQDLRRTWRVGKLLEAGMVGVNEALISTEVAPFGGVKESGAGREGSWLGLKDYMETKYLCMGGLDE